MEKLSKGEKIFLIYSVFNTIVCLMAIENVSVLNEDMAYGMFLSYMVYISSYLFYLMIKI